MGPVLRWLLRSACALGERALEVAAAAAGLLAGVVAAICFALRGAARRAWARHELVVRLRRHSTVDLSFLDGARR